MTTVLDTNPNPIQECYSDKAYCLKELGRARITFTNKETTRYQYDRMEDSLGMMFLYCPEEIQWMVHATLQEAGWRKSYFVANWLLTQED